MKAYHEKNRRCIGEEYERIAGEYLKQRGYEILTYNFYTKSGEIDIIARHEEYYVFVEVKYRTDEAKGHPLEAVSPSKQRAISKSALIYLQQQHLQDVPVRFDVVGILGKDITLLQNAFEFIT